jgi:hypothetical protein
MHCEGVLIFLHRVHANGNIFVINQFTVYVGNRVDTPKRQPALLNLLWADVLADI